MIDQIGYLKLKLEKKLKLKLIRKLKHVRCYGNRYVMIEKLIRNTMIVMIYLNELIVTELQS
jgi:hypothetical protein